MGRQVLDRSPIPNRTPPESQRSRLPPRPRRVRVAPLSYVALHRAPRRARALNAAHPFPRAASIRSQSQADCATPSHAPLHRVSHQHHVRTASNPEPDPLP
uniref:Uncharacterized protein n=1 Tax=Oryza glumipatula TaxID=40148 RepID=A0A0D9Y929_9ORYZ